jgi:hypothetical protein
MIGKKIKKGVRLEGRIVGIVEKKGVLSNL